MFSISGIYSGLDVNTIVDTLVNAERAPTEARLNRREQAYDVELSAVGQLKAALESFQEQVSGLNNVNNLSPRTATLSDESVLSATVASNAAEGTYTFYVDQLASRHQLISDPIASGSTMGTGTASFTVNGESFSVSLAAGSESLENLRDAINDSADNTGVQAVIVNDGSDQRLMLTSKDSGADFAISADFSGLTGGTASVGALTELQAAQDASIRFGAGAGAITLTSSDNTLENVIDGVSLELTSVSANPQTLQVSLDKESVKTSVQAFVDAWNGLKSTFDELTDYDGVSAGALNGDAQARIMENQLRRAFSQVFGDTGDPFRTLGDIGLKTTQTGTLTVDTVRLDEALSTNFDELAGVLAGGSGLMADIEGIVDNYLGVDGSLAGREGRISESLRDLEDERLALESRLERVRSYYQSQFLAMENLLSSLDGTSQWLTSNLSPNNNTQ
ncbi:MAG: flagellar filament capping protein FliD [Endozoicomonas sp.]